MTFQISVKICKMADDQNLCKSRVASSDSCLINLDSRLLVTGSVLYDNFTFIRDIGGEEEGLLFLGRGAGLTKIRNF